METKIISFDTPISTTLAEEINKQIYFVSPQISTYDLQEKDDKIHAIALNSLGKSFEDSRLETKVSEFIDTLVKNSLAIPTREIWVSQQKCSHYHPNVFEEMQERGWIYDVGTGLVAFAEPMIKLLNGLDRLIRDIAVNNFQAREYAYPTLIESAAIHRCRYAESFPHMLMFISRLHNDYDVYDKFLQDYRKRDGLGDYLSEYCRDYDYCLPPTMCYHCFHQFSDTELQHPDGQVVTARGKSFRYEGKSYQSLSRLCDFTIRETVFFGDKDFVGKARQSFMQDVLQVIDKLALAGNCSVGNDPFFCETQSLAKLANQKLFELKIELNLNLSEQQSISVASFNVHDDFFGKNFNITRDNEFTNSGCVGVGIERLAYAFVCQHGLDQKRWSELLDL